MSETRTVIFPKSKFTVAQARAFLRRKNLKSVKVDETSESFRFRQSLIKPKGRVRTISFGKDIKAVIQFKPRARRQ